ncbi:DNA excision repair protein ERCC-6-like [Leucoraja erinacea]|uniref:DNA excision repair protein ERCC-6-like n=1 Tax=Leucoraja erinaceus TaxID=7782 RepID=UPI002457DD61|nr:DNA excision repair protein ERCC-6-like [Leucoraja erinacea]
MRAAKQQARAGELREALALVAEAEELCPGQRRAARLREALEEAAAGQEEEDEEGDEEDEWAPVPGCSLRLYRPLLERLLPHQSRGVAFLHRLFTERRGGGILADDMGLGKTVQLLAFLSGMFDAGLVAHCLIIMPASLLATWLAEFTAWTPGIRVRVAFHGSKAERSRNLLRVQRKGGVVITTYQLIIYNLEELSQLDGQRFDWDYLVLDEAHKIKGHLSKTTKHVNALPAKNRVLLTGTPVQNNLQEMWTLFDFACQGSLLGPLKDFKLLYEAPITRAREKDTSPAEKALGLRISESLMALIQPYFLRRTKEGVQKPEEGGERPPATESETPDLLALSRKSDLIVWVHLNGVQEEIYRKFVSSDIIQELLQTKQSPLVQLNNLKKLCDHPRLLSKRLWEELELGGGGEYEVGRVPVEQLVSESGKLLFLLGLLEKLREEGHCTLVFSQSRRMLDIIQRVLVARGFRLARMDGTVTLADRQKVVEKFQRGGGGCSVFLLTTQVGGVGLTLTAASRVVVVDPSWNPATDAQAVDRAYRIGQTADVVIYRLVTCGTVEEKIYRRQIFKDSLIRQSVGERKNPMRYFSRQELRELFVLEDPMRSSTQLQLHSMHGSPRQAGPGHSQHLAFLRSLPMFGVTDHGLVHGRDGAPDEDEGGDSDPVAQRYIQERLRLAQDLVAAGTLAAREPGTLPPPIPPAPRGRGPGRAIPYMDYRVTQPPADWIQVPSDGEEEEGEAPDLSGVGEGEVEVPAPGWRDQPVVVDLTEGPGDGETEDSHRSCVGEPASPEVMEVEDDDVFELSRQMAELPPLCGVSVESPAPTVPAAPGPHCQLPGPLGQHRPRGRMSVGVTPHGAGPGVGLSPRPLAGSLRLPACAGGHDGGGGGVGGARWLGQRWVVGRGGDRQTRAPGRGDVQRRGRGGRIAGSVPGQPRPPPPPLPPHRLHAQGLSPPNPGHPQLLLRLPPVAGPVRAGGDGG